MDSGISPSVRSISMKVEWKVDSETQNFLWQGINASAEQVSASVKNPKVILDLGGGTGWFGLFLKKGHPDALLISVDTVPLPQLAGVEHAKGSALDIPLKSGCAQIMGAHAILHHVPDELEKCMAEVSRVLSQGGIFIAREPLGNNPFANLARKLVTTERHEEGERPVPYKTMEKAIGQKLKIEKAEFFFLTSYLLPHALPRVPRALSGLFKKLTLFFMKLDKKMLAGMPKLRKYAAYVSVVARKA
jgi:ubiquinone/menaquinone biosynthesis C-methylase UbiE